MTAKVIIPSVSIFSWHSNFYVVPEFINDRGLRANGHPISVVAQSKPSADLGAEILVAMERFGLSAPSVFEVRSWENGKRKPKDPVLVATGASSFSALWKDALYISSAEETPGTLHFYPSTKPSRGQYLFKRNKVLVPRVSPPDLIGDAARQAFERCD